MSKKVELNNEDFPSNSHKPGESDKKETYEKEVDGNKPKVEKVISGKVEKKKKTFTQKALSIFDDGDDKETVKSFLVWDVLVPNVKDLVSEMVSKGIDMMLFGESRRKNTPNVKRTMGNSRVRYDRNPGTRRGYHEPSYRDDRRYDRPQVNRARHNFDDIQISDRGDAEEVLDSLVELVSVYGMASVADFYDLIGMTGEHTDNKWGWTNLSRATVQRVRGAYVLNLPRTEEL